MSGGFAESGHVDEEIRDARGLPGGCREAEATATQARQGGLRHGGREGTGHDRIDGGAAETEHVGGGIARECGARGDRSAAGRPRGGHRNLAGHAPHAIPRP